MEAPALDTGKMRGAGRLTKPITHTHRLSPCNPAMNVISLITSVNILAQASETGEYTHIHTHTCTQTDTQTQAQTPTWWYWEGGYYLRSEMCGLSGAGEARQL